MSWVEEVVYQAVTPGEPEENGRSCLNGVNAEVVPVAIMGAAVLLGGSMIDIEVVGPLVAGGLGLTSAVRDDKK